jgi:hypothetical protein
MQLQKIVLDLKHCTYILKCVQCTVVMSIPCFRFFVFTLYTAIGRQQKLISLQLGARWKGNSLKLKTSGYNELFQKNET